MRRFLQIAFFCVTILIIVRVTQTTPNGNAAASSKPTMPPVASGIDAGASVITQSASQSTRGCTAADFSVSKTKAVTEYDEATLTGVVTNHCKSSAGIRLKWTAYNSDGTVAFSNDFWPASTTNIPPGRDYPFEMMNTAPRGKWTYRVEPAAVDVW